MSNLIESYQDFDFKDFVFALYQNPADPPFTYTLKFLNEMTKGDLQMALLYIVSQGSQILYQKKMGELTPKEIENIQSYLRSIGWQVKYVPDKKAKAGGKTLEEMTIRDYRIHFLPADPKMDQYHCPTVSQRMV